MCNAGHYLCLYLHCLLLVCGQWPIVSVHAYYMLAQNLQDFVEIVFII